MDRLPAPVIAEDLVVRFTAGVRPCRHGGPRLEAEPIGPRTVIHNYGHGGAGVTLCLGASAAAADLARAHAEPGEPVAVLGAGVIGLTTALDLARAGHPVRVLARDTPDRSTSWVAGALWLPTGVEWGDTPAERDRFTGWLRTAFDRFGALDPRRWGVRRLPVYEIGAELEDPRYFESGTVEIEAEFDAVPIDGLDLPGRRYSTLFIQTPRFLGAVLDELGALGAVIEPATVHSAADLDRLPERVVVNALGLGARAVFEDDALYPARGQLVHLRPQPLPYIYHEGYTYVFPRDDVLVLGGSFEPGVESDQPDETACRAILERHRQRFAEARLRAV